MKMANKRMMQLQAKTKFVEYVLGHGWQEAACCRKITLRHHGSTKVIFGNKSPQADYQT
jgi:hypothetical protein